MILSVLEWLVWQVFNPETEELMINLQIIVQIVVPLSFIPYQLLTLNYFLFGRLATSVVDVGGPPADWVKINVRQTVSVHQSFYSISQTQVTSHTCAKKINRHFLMHRKTVSRSMPLCQGYYARRFVLPLTCNNIDVNHLTWHPAPAPIPITVPKIKRKSESLPWLCFLSPD